MARINTPVNRLTERTHEGAPAYAVDALAQLRRSVMACLLWENEFYESGETIARRIQTLVPQVEPAAVAALAIEARSQMHLRHVPLLLVREMARLTSHKGQVRATLGAVIQRADELAEFLAIYWATQTDVKRRTLAKSVQRGLADAFAKFNAYELAKYNRDHAVKLRDVLFLSHAKPTGWNGDATRLPLKGRTADDGTPLLSRRRVRHASGQAAVWKQLIDGTLKAPDTWEVALSAGADKKATWERLIAERKLGALALLRNLRAMQQVGVADGVIASALRDMKPDRVLPFRFIAAVRYGPQFVSELDAALLQSLEGQPKLAGTTVVLVDISGSMDAPVSSKSDLHRVDAACGLATIARELCERVRIFSFSDSVREVAAYRGLALAAAINKSQPHGSTDLGGAVKRANQIGYDRLIVITDEQSQSPVGGPNGLGYMINVASNQNGVGYGPWMHIDGWSDRVLDYIRETEAQTTLVG